MANQQEYKNMSRDQLVALIGEDISPDTPREDLITMAMQRDSEDSM